MSKRDYYEVLGVDKNATPEELKKAYRKAAIKFHPDKNPDDKGAEDKFKEAAEAFDVLNNADKKARYDQFGHDGMKGGFGGNAGRGGGGFSMDDIFDQFGDIFGGGFGGFGGGRSQGQRVNRGSDLRVKVKLTLKDIAYGVDKKLKISKLVSCDTCSGTGAKDANSYTSCSTCQGSGYTTQVVNTFFGRQQTTRPCPSCNGEGKIISDKCVTCHGEGVNKSDEVVEIRIPAGVANGMQLSVSGRGNAAKRGGESGDLLVIIEEIADENLIREGNDLIYNLKLGVIDAILGASVEIPTVDGKAKIKIDAGTQPGKVLRLKKKGLPDINGYRHGDILVCVDIYIPESTSSSEKKTLEEMRDSKSFKPKDKGQNIFEKMRNYFR